MIGVDMYEFPDGTVGSNAGDCAQAWADEARRLRAENEALKSAITSVLSQQPYMARGSRGAKVCEILRAALRGGEK